MRDNVEAESPEDYFRKSITVPFLYCTLNEMLSHNVVHSSLIEVHTHISDDKQGRSRDFVDGGSDMEQYFQ
jgi:hypothetical protein